MLATLTGSAKTAPAPAKEPRLADLLNGRAKPAAPQQPSSAPVPTVKQFLYQLIGDAKKLSRREALNAVIDASPREIERLAWLVARLRGRYLAQVVDLGNNPEMFPGELEISELRRARERYEEAERGFAAIKAARGDGEIVLRGVRPEESAEAASSGRGGELRLGPQEAVHRHLREQRAAGDRRDADPFVAPEMSDRDRHAAEHVRHELAHRFPERGGQTAPFFGVADRSEPTRPEARGEDNTVAIDASQHRIRGDAARDFFGEAEAIVETVRQAHAGETDAHTLGTDAPERGVQFDGETPPFLSGLCRRRISLLIGRLGQAVHLQHADEPYWPKARISRGKVVIVG